MSMLFLQGFTHLRKGSDIWEITISSARVGRFDHADLKSFPMRKKWLLFVGDKHYDIFKFLKGYQRPKKTTIMSWKQTQWQEIPWMGPRVMQNTCHDDGQVQSSEISCVGELLGKNNNKILLATFFHTSYTSVHPPKQNNKLQPWFDGMFSLKHGGHRVTPVTGQV